MSTFQLTFQTSMVHSPSVSTHVMALHSELQKDSLPRRITIVGKTSSGKTTLAHKLSSVTGIKHVELDSLFWKPNWNMSSAPEMREKLDKALPADGSWIADGSYLKYADITWARADLIVWLDYPILWVLWHLIFRTVWRIVSGARVCGENRESWKGLFGTGEENIVRECLRQYRQHRVRFPELIREYGEGKMVILRNTRECEEWLKDVTTAEQASHQDIHG